MAGILVVLRASGFICDPETIVYFLLTA